MTGAIVVAMASRKARVTLAAAYAVGDTELDPTNATCSFSVNNDGTISSVGNDGSASGSWIDPVTAAGSAYEVRFTLDSGDTPTGTLGSWLALGTSRTLTLTTSVAGTLAASVTVEIRRAADSVVLDTADLTMTSNRVI